MNTTIENNKIIAEFMGYIDNGCSEEGFLINPITNFDEEINDLRYHSNWNWLMEVVEKISQNKNYSESKEYRNFCLLKITDNKEKVYFTCVEFIKYYNEQTR